MFKRLLSVMVLSFALAGVASAQTLPEHYPDTGFDDIGRVDGIDIDKDRIVINDMSYTLSASLVVNSLSSAKDSILRVREGSLIGYKTIGGRTVTEIWLLPKNYKPRGRR